MLNKDSLIKGTSLQSEYTNIELEVLQGGVLPNARNEVLDRCVVGHDVDHTAVEKDFVFQVLLQLNK